MTHSELYAPENCKLVGEYHKDWEGPGIEIPLTRNEFALIDPDDFAKINQHKWLCCSRGYARRTVYGDSKKWQAYMHKEIIEIPDGMFTDHINGNRLDNRKCNLRAVDRKQNGRNRRKHIKGSSEYKGVSWSQGKKKWIARITITEKQVELGAFDSQFEAAVVYNHAANKYFGEYAHLNKPMTGYYDPVLKEVVKIE